jgi:hypothetical protein
MRESRSSWECRPKIVGRGLLIRLGRALIELREGGVGNSEAARGRAPEPGGMHGEASDTTWPSSRAHHDIPSSSVRSPSPSRPVSVNSSTVAEPGVVVDFLITSGWIFTRCAAGALHSCSIAIRYRQTSVASWVYL